MRFLLVVQRLDPLNSHPAPKATGRQLESRRSTFNAWRRRCGKVAMEIHERNLWMRSLNKVAKHVALGGYKEVL